MPNTDAISQRRTYWGVCCIREHDGKWIPRSWTYDSEEEGQRKLRWLRQWHPKAFLVEMEMTTVRDNFSVPPLPQRSRLTSNTQPESTDKSKQLEETSTVQGLRLVK